MLQSQYESLSYSQKIEAVVNMSFKEIKAMNEATQAKFKLAEKSKELQKKAKKNSKELQKLLKKAAKAEAKAEKTKVKTEDNIEVKTESSNQEGLSTLSGNLNDLVSKVTKTGEVRFSALSEEERAKVVAAISQSLNSQGSSAQEPEPEMVEHVEPVGIKPIEMTVSEGDDGITNVEVTIGRATAAIPPEQDTPMGNALRNANRGNRQRGERQ